MIHILNKLKEAIPCKLRKNNGSDFSEREKTRLGRVQPVLQPVLRDDRKM